MYDTLFSLRESAKDLFAQVSKVFRIYNHNCIPAGHLDPLLEPKLLAQEFVVHESKLLRLTPISIVGFGFLMPNERMGYLAFSKYPTVLECCNKMIPVSIKDCWSYTGLLETFVKNCDNYSYAKCVESHILACKLLSKANKLEALLSVKDPTNYWSTKDIESLSIMAGRSFYDFHKNAPD
jgi:hypothetical protein